MVLVRDPKPLVVTTPWYTLPLSRGIRTNRGEGLGEPVLIKVAKLCAHPAVSELVTITLNANCLFSGASPQFFGQRSREGNP